MRNETKRGSLFDELGQDNEEEAKRDTVYYICLVDFGTFRDVSRA